MMERLNQDQRQFFYSFCGAVARLNAVGPSLPLFIGGLPKMRFDRHSLENLSSNTSGMHSLARRGPHPVLTGQATLCRLSVLVTAVSKAA
jgi:hypothetical protein